METKPLTLGTLLISAVAVMTIELAAAGIIARGILPPSTGLGLARMLQVLAMAMVLGKLEDGLMTVGVSRSTVVKGLRRGLIWSLGFGLAGGLLLGALWLLGINVARLFQVPGPCGPDEILAPLAVGVILGPLAEELLFRGILFGYFRKFGFGPALIISTLLFAVPHMIGSGIPLAQIAGGLLFAAAYEVEKNLVAPVVIHCLGNLAIFSLACIAACT
jgi:membrane protease YdiL (CAAX protease family)